MISLSAILLKVIKSPFTWIIIACLLLAGWLYTCNKKPVQVIDTHLIDSMQQVDANHIKSRDSVDNFVYIPLVNALQNSKDSLEQEKQELIRKLNYATNKSHTIDERHKFINGIDTTHKLPDYYNR